MIGPEDRQRLREIVSIILEPLYQARAATISECEGIERAVMLLQRLDEGLLHDRALLEGPTKRGATGA